MKDAARVLAEASAVVPSEQGVGGNVDRSAQEPLPLWCQRAEEASLDYHRQRVAAYEAVHALRAKGADVADIARTVGISRQTAYHYLSMSTAPARRRRRFERRDRVLDPYEDYLRRRWSEGCHNGMQLWREIRAQGFAYSSSPVSRFVAHLRQDPSLRPARRVRSALTSVRGPYARQDFATMLRQREGERLDAWTETAAQSGSDDLKRFALGLRDDYAAVQAGLTLEYSTGQVEGQVHRLKLVRRSMYGRGRFDLLERRVLPAA